MQNFSFSRRLTTALGCLLLPVFAASAATPAVIQISVRPEARPISPDLFGIFFEDINYAADGGLYAELVQNRSFEYSATEQLAWGPLTAWEKVTRGNGRGSLAIADAVPVHPNNPHYVVIETQEPDGGVGLANAGFDGIVVQSGSQYDFSMFARQLFTGNHWGGSGKLAYAARFLIQLETKSGAVLGATTLELSGREWQRKSVAIVATNSDAAARLVVSSQSQGGVAVDEISLFPHATFKNRPNGLRSDLAQAIADLRPKFMRFPGGCLVHGHGLNNMYRWKESIGPVEQRRGQANLWGYHQSLGLGYFEFFQFCEDIGAKPLPVVPAGVCCQNADHQGGTGQRGLPLEEMPAYIQDVLDLIEWANGPADSEWGARRAAAGHPEPFHLQYLGIGNEEHITAEFRERFKLVAAAVRNKHPELTVIGTVGPFHSGEDFEAGWRFADELQLEMVDEHYYEKPEWFVANLSRYDRYDRSKSKVYLGEYAAHEPNRANTLRTALAEAAYLTGLERNGDVVQLASYAPLLARQGHTQWRPDLIYFDATRILRSANYYVQQLFSRNSGDQSLPTSLRYPEAGNRVSSTLAASCVRDSASGDTILKLVNRAETTQLVQLDTTGVFKAGSQAVVTILQGQPAAVNTFDKPDEVIPTTSTRPISNRLSLELPPGSLSVIRGSSP